MLGHKDAFSERSTLRKDRQVLNCEAVPAVHDRTFQKGPDVATDVENQVPQGKEHPASLEVDRTY
jgi:hypothetical protein